MTPRVFDPEVDDHRRFVHDFEFTVSNNGHWWTYLLNGPAGAVQFVMSHLDPSWTGVDVGHHSPVPRGGGESRLDCDVLHEGACFYDGSSLRADRWLDGWDGTRDQMLDLLMAEYAAALG